MNKLTKAQENLVAKIWKDEFIKMYSWYDIVKEKYVKGIDCKYFTNSVIVYKIKNDVDYNINATELEMDKVLYTCNEMFNKEYPYSITFTADDITRIDERIRAQKRRPRYERIYHYKISYPDYIDGYIYVNIMYLRDILRATKADTVYFDSPFQPIYCKGKNIEAILYPITSF